MTTTSPAASATAPPPSGGRFAGLPAEAREQISAFRAKRQALALAIITAPEKKLHEHAADLGLSQSFVYAVHSSDDFQALLADLAAEHSTAVLNDHAGKLSMLYTVAMEKSIERIHSGSASEGFLTTARQDAMAAKGFTRAASGGEAATSVVVNVSAAILSEARARALAAEGSIPRAPSAPERKESNVPPQQILGDSSGGAPLGSNSGAAAISGGPAHLSAEEILGE